MAVSFACRNCNHKLSPAVDSGGLAVECPNCAQASVVPTTIARASKIADRIENMLAKQDYVAGTTFMRLSTIGASTRMEVFRALMIVVAETFQSAFRRPQPPDARRQFDEFASALGGLNFRLATSVVPDSELGLIAKLHAKYAPEFLQEERRLQSLLMSDAAWNQSETTESFV